MQEKDDMLPDVEQIDTVDNQEMSKKQEEMFTPEEERKLVRKLDFWYVASHAFGLPTTANNQKDHAALDGHIHASKLRQRRHGRCHTVQLRH